MSLDDIIPGRLSAAMKQVVTDAFDDLNAEMRVHNPLYTLAANVVDEFDPEAVEKKVAEMKAKGYNGDPYAVFDRAEAERRRDFKNRIENDSLDVELLCNLGASDGSVELLVPVRVSDGTRIEKDIGSHVKQVAKQYDRNVKSGKVGKYLALNVKTEDVGGLVKNLRDTSDAFGLAKVSMDVYMGGFPDVGVYTQMQRATFRRGQSSRTPRSLVKEVLPSYLKYNLVITHQADAPFFPDVGTDFVLETPVGNTKCHLTSDGKYFQGGLKPIYEQMGVQVGDKIRITRLVHHKRYKMDKV